MIEIRDVDVVIGTGYGDEGKGHIVNYLAQKSHLNTLVVRFNSGAQAGHTVVRDDGSRHVFHSFGSASFENVPTLLSRFFVVNPVMFFREANELVDKLGFAIPRPYVDSRALVTTHFDVFINQEVEKIRGDDRHGSCGLGFGETIERAERGFPLTVHNLTQDGLRDKLVNIRDNYVPNRLIEMGIEDVDTTRVDDAIDVFLSFVDDFLSSIDVVMDTQIMSEYQHVIMEGAQGLLLDQYSDDFPHVTRSSTGMENAGTLLYEIFGDSPIGSRLTTVYYLTRAYATRHGAGPFKHEVFEDRGIVDETNVINDYQGSLRFGTLDYERMGREVRNDIAKAGFPITNIVATITHLDQSSKINKLSMEEVVDKVIEEIGTNNLCLSFGEKPKDVYEDHRSMFSLKSFDKDTNCVIMT